MHARVPETYRAEVARVFRDEGGTVFNGTLAHAQVVTEEAFLAASKRVRVLVNRIPSRQFDSDDVVQAATAFLDRPHTQLELLVERDISRGDSAFAKAVLGAPNVKVRRVPDDIQNRYEFNLITVDDTAFRFQDDRAIPAAVVSGGKANAATTKHLNGLFADLWAMSTPVGR